MARLTRREFLKLSGQALAATGTVCLTSGLLGPAPAQAETLVELDGNEMVSRVGDTFATMQMVPMFSRSKDPATISARVRYGTDPTLSAASESPVATALYFRWSEGGLHLGEDGSSDLVVLRKCRLDKYDWDIEPGDLIRNKTDKSVMVVSAVEDERTISGTLSGGTRNTWDRGDKWRIDRVYYCLEVKLTGLAPDTTYYYRVQLRYGSEAWQAPREIHSFHTRRPRGQAFRFAIIADCHRKEKHWPEWDAMIGGLHDDQIDLLIDVGDTWPLVSGHGKPHPNYLPPLYSACRQVRNGRPGFRGLSDVAADCGYYFARGNHEGLSDYDPRARHALLTGLMRTFIPNPTGMTYLQGGSHDEDYDQGYFAFEWGDALLVVLDAIKYKDNQRDNKSPDRFHIGQTQLSWLTSVLQGSTSRWKFLFMHHLFGGGNNYARGGAAFAFLHEQAQIQALCEQYGAQVIFYGHDHLLAQGLANGVLYYTCGSACGGKDLFDDKDSLYPDGYSSPCGSGECDYFGYVLVDVTPTVVTLRYKNYQGEVKHEMTLT